MVGVFSLIQCIACPDSDGLWPHSSVFVLIYSTGNLNPESIGVLYRFEYVFEFVWIYICCIIDFILGFLLIFLVPCVRDLLNSTDEYNR